MQWLTIVDTLGNEKVYRYSESLKPLGLPAFVYLLEQWGTHKQYNLEGRHFYFPISLKIQR